MAQSAADPCADTKTQLTRAENRLKDWPATGPLSRREWQNYTAGVRTNCAWSFMGDSITDSWDDPKFGGFFPGKPYVDRGISGQTTPQMLVRFRADVIALQPKAVVILAGTNDLSGNTGPTTLEAIEDNLISMAELAKAQFDQGDSGFTTSGQRLRATRRQTNCPDGAQTAGENQSAE